MPVLNGKAYWASVVTPNTTFDEDGVYSIDLAVDEENKKSAVERLKDLKDLLDLEAISQEDYDSKKKSILEEL